MPALYIAQELPSLTETSSLHNLIPPHLPPPPNTPGNEEKTKFLRLGPLTKKGP
jgi:hypothetical protein